MAPIWARELREGCDIALVCVLVVLAPQMIGGTPPWAIVTISGGVLCALALTFARGRRLRGEVPWAAWAGALALSWTVIQAIPLPAQIVSVIAPVSYERLSQVHELLGREVPRWCAISRAPGATRWEVLKGFALLGTFVVASRAQGRRETRALYFAVALSAVAMAASGLGHAVTDAQSVYGFYKPIQRFDQPALAPLLNMNVFGGFLAAGSVLLVGLGLGERALAMRMLLLAAAAGTGTGVLASRSRAAVGALVLGLLLLTGLVLWRGRRTRRRKGRTRPSAFVERSVLALTGVTFAGAGWYIFSQGVHEEFERGGLGKLELIARALAESLEHPLLGIGRGAFASAFSPPDATQNRFEYAESFVVQWAVEWGWAVTLVVVVGIGATLWRALHTKNSSARLGAVAAVLTCAAHNLLDLGLELLGVALVAAALLGALSARERGRAEKRKRRRLGLHAAVLGAGTLAWTVLVPSAGTEDADALRAQAEASLSEGDYGQLEAVLARALEAYPSEPTFALIGATAAVRQQRPSAARWINQALRVAPGWAAPHVLAASWLWNTGHRSQAFVELREAAERSVAHTLALLCPLARADFEGTLGAVPKGPQRLEFLNRLAACLPRDSKESESVDLALIEEGVELTEPYLRHAQRLAKAGHVDEALKLLRELRARRPRDAAVLRALAQMLLAAGRAHDVIALTEDLPLLGEDRRKLMELRAQSYAALGDLPSARETLQRLRADGSADVAAVARTWGLEAALEARAQDVDAAIQAYERAFGISGDARYLSDAARTAESATRLRQAHALYTRACLGARPANTACAARERLAKRLGLGTNLLR